MHQFYHHALWRAISCLALVHFALSANCTADSDCGQANGCVFPTCNTTDNTCYTQYGEDGVSCFDVAVSPCYGLGVCNNMTCEHEQLSDTYTCEEDTGCPIAECDPGGCVAEASTSCQTTYPCSPYAECNGRGMCVYVDMGCVVSNECERAYCTEIGCFYVIIADCEAEASLFDWTGVIYLGIMALGISVLLFLIWGL